jgi:hypothetical protein
MVPINNVSHTEANLFASERTSNEMERMSADRRTEWNVVCEDDGAATVSTGVQRLK